MPHKITLSLLLGTVLVGGLTAGGHLINKSLNTYYFETTPTPETPAPEAKQADQKIFNAQTFTLDNGMQVVLIRTIKFLSSRTWFGTK